MRHCGVYHRERTAINALAPDEWRTMGRLKGDARVLETVDGKTPYADRPSGVICETINEARIFNASVGVVRGIDLDLDTRDHAGVAHAYCSTEYREQRSTCNAELQLIADHVNQRSLTVGMSRRRHNADPRDR